MAQVLPFLVKEGSPKSLSQKTARRHSALSSRHDVRILLHHHYMLCQDLSVTTTFINGVRFEIRASLFFGLGISEIMLEGVRLGPRSSRIKKPRLTPHNFRWWDMGPAIGIPLAH